MHDIRGGCDRIGAEEQAFAGFLSSGNQSPRRGFVAGDGCVGAMLLLGGGSETYLIDAECEVVAVIVAVGQHFHVRCDEGRFLGELAFEEVNSFVNRPVEQPADDTQGEHVSRLEHGFVVYAAVLERLFGQVRQCHRHNLYRLRQTKLGERVVGGVQGFLEVGVGERIGINNNYRVTFEQCVSLVEGSALFVELRT